MKFDTNFYIYEEPVRTFTKRKGKSAAKAQKFRDIRYGIEYRAWLRTMAGEAQNWKCCYCGCETNDVRGHRQMATLEHVIPRSKGGEDSFENAAMACMSCNSRRGHQDAFEFLENGSVKGKSNNKKDRRILLQKRNFRKKVRKAEKLLEQGFANSGAVSFSYWVKTLKGMSQMHRNILVAMYEEEFNEKEAA